MHCNLLRLHSVVLHSRLWRMSPQLKWSVLNDLDLRFFVMSVVVYGLCCLLDVWHSLSVFIIINVWCVFDVGGTDIWTYRRVSTGASFGFQRTRYLITFVWFIIQQMNLQLFDQSIFRLSYCCITIGYWCLSVHLSVMLCTVAKQYVLQQRCLNMWIRSVPLGTQFYNFQPCTVSTP